MEGPFLWTGSRSPRSAESSGTRTDSQTSRSRGLVGEVVPGAALPDLDPGAIAFARQEYKKKNPSLVAEVDEWR